MDKKVLNTMFDNLLHIGNKTNFWNAKMKPYIYGSVNWIHIINLLETEKKLEEVKKELTKLNSEGKKVLFVWTKLQAKDSVEKIAKATWSFYVTDTWVPGLLTNFKTIKRRISAYLKLLKDSETGAFDMLTKKEKAAKMLELEKLNKAYRWVKDMKKLPDVIFAVDGIYEIQALREASNLSIKSFAIFNTNWDDMIVDDFIVANTNAVKSLDFIVEELNSCFKWAQKQTNTSKVKKIEVKKTPIKKEEKKETPTKKIEEKETNVKSEEVSEEKTKKVVEKKVPTKKTEK